ALRLDRARRAARALGRDRDDVPRRGRLDRRARARPREHRARGHDARERGRRMSALEPTATARFGLERRVTPFGVFLGISAAVAGVAALTTDGFLTVANLKAILFTGSFVGIAAVGTSVLMLGGNLFSLSLGTTISVSAIAFLSALRHGLAAAIVLTLLLGLAI